VIDLLVSKPLLSVLQLVPPLQHGATILQHWIHHYLDLGVKPEHFLVVVNSKTGERTKEVDECTRILDEKGIAYVLWLSQYSSEIMYKYRMELQAKVGLAQIGHVDHTGCYVDHAGRPHLVSSTVPPTRVAATPGCQVDYTDHTGFSRSDWCLTAK
jgi:hypothetical protein